MAEPKRNIIKLSEKTLSELKVTLAKFSPCVSPQSFIEMLSQGNIESARAVIKQELARLDSLKDTVEVVSWDDGEIIITIDSITLNTYSTPQAKLKNRVRLRSLISSGIRRGLKHKRTGGNWEKYVGYTLDDLIKHLESKFKPGMHWGNIGQWHIDHILPISAFNFNSVNDPEFKKCWALSNLQPLWARENLRKHAKYNQGDLDKVLNG